MDLSTLLILALAGAVAARVVWSRLRRRPRGPVVVIGAELARARAAEQARAQHPAGPSPLPPGTYDAGSGDLADPAPLPLDDALAQLARRYAAADADGRAAMRRAISMDELYTLLTFARRAAVFAIRRGDPSIVRDALAAVAMIESDRVDFRDALMAIALLHHAAERTGRGGDAMLQEAAPLAEPGTADLLAGFAARDPEDKHIRDAWGFAEVQSAGGPGFVSWGFQAYAPRQGLDAVANDLSAMLAADRYDPDFVTLATELPAFWLQPGGPALTAALAGIRAGASLSGHLRPDAHPNHVDQQLTVFLVEAADEAAARTLLDIASNGARRAHALVAAAEGPLFCLVVARSFVDGVPPYETQETLARFGPRVGEILRRHRP